MLREQANIKTLATQIQSSMQHYVRASSGSFSVTNGACHRGGPPSSHFTAAVCRRLLRGLALGSERSCRAHACIYTTPRLGQTAAQNRSPPRLGDLVYWPMGPNAPGIGMPSSDAPLNRRAG